MQDADEVTKSPFHFSTNKVYVTRPGGPGKKNKYIIDDIENTVWKGYTGSRFKLQTSLPISCPVHVAGLSAFAPPCFAPPPKSQPQGKKDGIDSRGR